MDGGSIRNVVVGIGINVNRGEFPEEIRDRATSLAIETGADVPRAELIAVLLERFEQLYLRFSEEQSLSFLREGYDSLCVNCRRRVRVLETSRDWEGTALGIDDGGELLVEREDGRIVPVYAGEVSVRGIYGYV